MEVFDGFLGLKYKESLVPAIRKMYNKIQKDISDEFFSALRHVPSDVDPKCQRFDLDKLSDCDWVEVSRGRWHDQNPQAWRVPPIIDAPRQDTLFPLHTHPTLPCCSSSIHSMSSSQNNSTSLVTSIWDEWFSNLIAAVDPSTLPFTPDFLPLHAVLVDLMEDRLKRSGICRHSTSQVPSARPRRKLDKFDLSFLELSTDYFIHLSLHPFALEADGFDTIVCFLSSVLSSHLNRNPFIHFRKALIEEMDVSALYSSSQPLILTSELARSLSDKEAIAIVDRIVAHIDSSTSTRLPELFRKTGRTKDQYFKALESCLSLGLDSLLFRKDKNIEPPVFKLFLSWHDYDSPRQGDWQDIYFETIPILMRVLELDRHPCSRNSKRHNCRLKFVIVNRIQYATPSVVQVSRTRHERSMDPSEKYVMTYFSGQHTTTIKELVQWTDNLLTIYTDCEHLAIARVFCKLGFFIQIVNGIWINDDSSSSYYFLFGFNRAYGERVQNRAQKREWNHGGKLCLDEEGWEDAMEFVLIPKKKRISVLYGRMITEQVHASMSICGANLGRMDD
ncbi:hypothetical protein BLNAU_24981 [Blattamonas nauphoetae]|uniref:TLDc domain-containing protein n=1 Tax=Blattamonas nauphoetae TaxID=2049346 RepID=A0ABQ9WKW3_9EUKA|nr:hypothetical protein BLNAU_24981 [Blattamonas nauphoetae]